MCYLKKFKIISMAHVIFLLDSPGLQLLLMPTADGSSDYLETSQEKCRNCGSQSWMNFRVILGSF